MSFLCPARKEMQQSWTPEQVAHMEPHTEVAKDGVLLPSLTQACLDMELDEGEPEVMRQHLQAAAQAPSTKPFCYECPKIREMRVLLQCPICHTIPHHDEIVSVCHHHHHLCFRCLLAVASSSNPSCPMRCGPLVPGAPPSPLLRNLLELLDARTAQLSEEWQLYQQLVHCGYYKQPWCTRQLRHFAGLVKNETTMHRMRGCVDMYRNYRAFRQALPSPDVAPQI